MERIFIEERIYKRIETKKSAKVSSRRSTAASSRLPTAHQASRRRGCGAAAQDSHQAHQLFDIEKNKEEIDEISRAIAAVDAKLADLVRYALSYIDELKTMLGVKEHQRRSTIKTFELVDVKEVAERNLAVPAILQTATSAMG